MCVSVCVCVVVFLFFVWLLITVCLSLCGCAYLAMMSRGFFADMNLEGQRETSGSMVCPFSCM